MISPSKVGYIFVSHSNTVPTGRRFGQCSAVKFHLASVLGLVSGRPAAGRDRGDLGGAFALRAAGAAELQHQEHHHHHAEPVRLRGGVGLHQHDRGHRLPGVLLDAGGHLVLGGAQYQDLAGPDRGGIRLPQPARPEPAAVLRESHHDGDVEQSRVRFRARADPAEPDVLRDRLRGRHAGRPAAVDAALRARPHFGRQERGRARLVAHRAAHLAGRRGQPARPRPGAGKHPPAGRPGRRFHRRGAGSRTGRLGHHHQARHRQALARLCGRGQRRHGVHRQEPGQRRSHARFAAVPVRPVVGLLEQQRRPAQQRRRLASRFHQLADWLNDPDED